MTTGSILLGVALAVIVGLLLARPFLQASQREQVRLSYRQSLLAEKDAILDQIRDLDFDHDTGKMPDEVHQRQRAQLMNNAAEMLRQLEQLDGESSPDTVGQDVDAAIETAVARMRQGKAKAVQAPQAVRIGGAFCPNCGQAVDAGDNFCVACGRKL